MGRGKKWPPSTKWRDDPACKSSICWLNHIVYLYNARIRYFKWGGGRGKRIRLKCYTFIAIILSYVNQNAHFEEIFFDGYTINFFFFSVCWLGWARAGQLNFEIVPADPAHLLVTLVWWRYFENLFECSAKNTFGIANLFISSEFSPIIQNLWKKQLKVIENWTKITGKCWKLNKTWPKIWRKVENNRKLDNKSTEINKNWPKMVKNYYWKLAEDITKIG